MSKKVKFNEAQMASKFNNSKSQAKRIVQDKSRVQDTLYRAMDIADEFQGPLAKVWSNLGLMFQVLGDWTSGRYTAIPTGAIVGIIAGLLYLIMPVDAIPDFIPGFGYVDDVAVLGWVIDQVSKDLMIYKKWRKNTR